MILAKWFGGFGEILQKEWQFFNLDFASKQKAIIINLDFDNAWKIILTTKMTDGTFKYPTITKLINAIRSSKFKCWCSYTRTFSMLTDMKTKKRSKLSPIHVQAVWVFKLNLRTRGKAIQAMKVEIRHLILISSKNLYQTLPFINYIIFKF